MRTTQSKNAKRNMKKKNRIRSEMAFNAPMGNPRSIVIPNEFDANLTFYYSSNMLLAAASAISRVFTPNCPFDFDPLLGSTNTAGFAELANLFQFCRAIEYKYHIEMGSAYTTPLNCIVYNSNLTPGTAGLVPYVGNQNCQQKMNGGLGSPPTVFEGHYKIADIVGSRSVETDDNFASTTAGKPADLTFLSLGFDSITGGAITTAGFFTMQIKCLVRFYEKKTVSS